MGSTIPVWGAVILAVSVALLTQAGSLIIQRIQLRAEQDRRRVEEWHRNLRWAVELISKGDNRSIVMGVGALGALDDRSGLNEGDQNLIDNILLAVVDYREAKEDNGETKEPIEPDQPPGGELT